MASQVLIIDRIDLTDDIKPIDVSEEISEKLSDAQNFANSDTKLTAAIYKNRLADTLSGIYWVMCLKCLIPMIQTRTAAQKQWEFCLKQWTVGQIS